MNQSPFDTRAYRSPNSLRPHSRAGWPLALALLLAAASLRPPLAAAQLALPGLAKPVAAPPSAPAAAAPAPQPATPAPVQPIPLPQIADEAEALDVQLEDISRGLNNKQDEITPNPVTAEQEAEIAERARQVDSLLHNAPDILQLREEIVYWRSLSRLATDQRKLLTARADELQSQVALLNQEQARWQATQDEIHDTAGIEVVAARVQHELDAIREIRVKAQTQLNQVLTLQNELSETGRKIADSLAKLTEAEARFRVSLFDQDGQPWWSSRSQEAHQPMVLLLRRSVDQEVVTGKEFLRARGIGLLLLPIVFFLSWIAAFRLKGYLSTGTGPEISTQARAVFARPFFIALLATLLLCIPLTQGGPLSITAAIYLLWIGLLFRMTPILVRPEMRALIYLLLALNLLELLRAAVPAGQALRQALLPVLILAVLLAFVWLARPSRLRRMELSKWSFLCLLIVTRAGIVLLGIALLANASGFVSLSRALGVGTLISSFIAAAIYFVIRVALMALAILLESPWLRFVSSDMRSAIYLWSRRALIVIGVALWWSRSELFVLMFQESIGDTASRVLQYPIGLGKMHFTLGNVLIVLLILIIGFTLSRGFSSLVRSVLVSRFPLQRGLPYAISKVTYYCLCVVVVLAAVTAAGVDLNRFTVITGAVGVGVGFGLQNIVNNFASGLILLFERPIRIDDTVEVNGLVGKVKRIGARSSTIATFQGAEVIVPNSNLVQNHVINWTLSSPWRRIEIPVGVAYGTDPETVMKLLVAEAAAHESVMEDPEPVAFFMGFGDSALNFELRFWSARQDIWFQVKSDVTVAVSRALSEAGIEIPFPQRDLHLRSSELPIANPAQLVAHAPAETKTESPAGDKNTGNNTAPQPSAEHSAPTARLGDAG